MDARGKLREENEEEYSEKRKESVQGPRCEKVQETERNSGELNWSPREQTTRQEYFLRMTHTSGLHI